MTDITNLINQWLFCSNDIWSKWFSERENGAEEFYAVNELLLEVLVFNNLGLGENETLEDTFFAKLRVEYLQPVNDTRQLCNKQKAGNVFCSAEKVSIQDGSIYFVKDIDALGTMMHGKPYVEVFYKDGYILESPSILKFIFDKEL